MTVNGTKMYIGVCNSINPIPIPVIFQLPNTVIPSNTQDVGGAGKWFHITWVMINNNSPTNSNWLVYINGIFYCAFNSQNYPVSITRSEAYFGKPNYDAGSFLFGSIFDFKIYNGYLNSSDVLTEYTNSKKVLSSLSSNLDFYVVPPNTDPLAVL